jgi:UDP-2,3-diacylglucosamine hydrolase
MTTLFISDLHLEPYRPDITELFLRFLNTTALKADALYILGDFFEAWIGDDDTSDFHQTIITALHQATQQGLPIYFTHGNRDFLIGKKFLRASGCQLLPEEYVIDLYGTPTLVMHGDTLCTLDENYLKFRKKTRKWWVQKLFLLKSLKKRRAIAAKMRADSKEYTSTAPDYLMDVTQTEVERVMQKHQVRHLIHGHTHREAIHHFDLTGQAAKRIVLGAWHDRGSVLVCEKKSGSLEKNDPDMKLIPLTF